MKNIFYFLFLPFMFFPRFLVPKFGNVIGSLYYFLDKKHRKEIELRMSLSICNKININPVVATKNFYKQLGIFALELLKMPYLSRRDISKLVPLTQSDKFNEILKKGKGVIIVTGHFSNWEYAGLAISSSGIPVNTVAKPLKQKTLDRFLVQCREKFGQKIISQESALKGLLRSLKKNEATILLMDYDTHPDKGGIFVPFFERLVATLPTPAFLMAKTKSPIVVTRLKRLPDFSYEVQIGDIIEFDEYKDRKDFEYPITARIQSAFEGFILEDPEQWLWLQRRWRFNPEEFSQC